MTNKAAITGGVLVVINIVLIVFLSLNGLLRMMSPLKGLLFSSDEIEKMNVYLKLTEKHGWDSMMSVSGYVSKVTPSNICLWTFDGNYCYSLTKMTDFQREEFCDTKKLDRLGLIRPLSENMNFSDWKTKIGFGSLISLTIKIDGSVKNIVHAYATDRDYLGNCR